MKSYGIARIDLYDANGNQTIVPVSCHAPTKSKARMTTNGPSLVEELNEEAFTCFHEGKEYKYRSLPGLRKQLLGA